MPTNVERGNVGRLCICQRKPVLPGGGRSMARGSDDFAGPHQRRHRPIVHGWLPQVPFPIAFATDGAYCGVAPNETMMPGNRWS